MYLNVNSICLSPLNEGRPQPVVNIWVANIADHVAPPVDALVEVGEALLDPAWGGRLRAFGVLEPVQHGLLGGVEEYVLLSRHPRQQGDRHAQVSSHLQHLPAQLGSQTLARPLSSIAFNQNLPLLFISFHPHMMAVSSI